MKNTNHSPLYAKCRWIKFNSTYLFFLYRIPKTKQPFLPEYKVFIYNTLPDTATITQDLTTFQKENTHTTTKREITTHAPLTAIFTYLHQRQNPTDIDLLQEIQTQDLNPQNLRKYKKLLKYLKSL